MNKTIAAATRSMIEPLEGRVLMSVSASTIANPLANAGTVETYQTTSAGVVDATITESGTGTTATYDGATANVVDVSTTGSSSGTTVSSTVYNGLTADGLVSYGSVTTSTVNNVQSTIQETDNPFAVAFPASAVGGVTTTTAYTETNVRTTPGEAPVTTVTNFSEQFELTDEQLHPVVVNGVTYEAYLVDTTETSTDSDGSNPTTSTSQEYIAPGKGLVQAIEDPGANQVEENLISFTTSGSGGGGGGGTVTPVSGTGITPTLTKDTVPTAVVTGAKLRGAALRLTLDNTLATPEVGYTVRVYASTTTTLDTTVDPLVTSVPKLTTIKAGKTTPLSIPITTLPTTLANGTYYLIAQTEDAAGNTESVTTPTTVTVAAPFVSLSETVTTALPLSLVSGAKAKGSVKLKITNNGNVASTGITPINLSASTTAGIIGTSFATLSKRISIPVGRTVTVSVPVTSLPVLTNGNYYVVAQTTDPDGGITLASSTNLTTIAAPFINLSVALGPIVKIKSGDTVVVSNLGNIADVTTITGTFGVALDAAGTEPVGSTVTLTSHKFNILPGKSVKMHVTPSKAFLADLAAGVPYYLTLSYIDQTGHSGFVVSSNSFTL